MNRLKSPLVVSTIVATSLSAVALVITMVFGPYLESNAFVPFLVAVWICAWYHGRAGGVTSTVVCAAAILYFFFIRPDPTLVLTFGPLFRVLIFVAMASLLTWVTASWRDSRSLLAAALTSIADAVIATDRKGRIIVHNSAAEALTGWPRVEVRGKPASRILKMIDEPTRKAIDDPLTRVLRDRIRGPKDEPAILISRSGAEIPIEYSAAPMRDDSEWVWGAILIFRDISKRRQIDEQMLHEQKMDAVSRLAGGVAGDFSNVLTVITGYADLLHAEVPANSPMQRLVDEIVYAGERAAALTRHLHAFSGGTTGQLRPLDLNALLSSMEPLLRRVLGQNIELIVLTTPKLGRVKADAAQIELVVVNLANNAREAMPNGGKLVIETANVELEDAPAGKNLGLKPGSYVMFAVSDTGVGMDAETRSRLFEPFFTTKPPGKGSGLGLATVYGTVKQCDGQVTVYSQPNCGTIFEIYLPRVKEEIPSEQPVKHSGKGSETILLVDDEEGVRKLLTAILKSNGYDVLEANNGAAALAVYEKNAHKIDIVVTDIVMPQMTGFELGVKLVERTPGLKLLYISGYQDNALGGAVGGAPGAFLHKPFTPDVLLAKVREVLDAIEFS